MIRWVFFRKNNPVAMRKGLNGREWRHREDSQDSGAMV